MPQQRRAARELQIRGYVPFEDFAILEKTYDWSIRRGAGPVLATAVHSGHALREALFPYLAASEEDLRREEDPLTDIWASVGDHVFCSRRSRFEADLNRSRERALSTHPQDTWGITFWNGSLPDALLEDCLQQHDAFYGLMRSWIEDLIATHRRVLLLDIHSYNYRRGGPQGTALEEYPDIDLGVTTADRTRFSPVIDVLRTQLAETPVPGRALDVRENVRYPDGGHFPEWVFSNYGSEVCTITLEYKKFYMNEWTGEASVPVVEALRQGLQNAVEAVRGELSACA